MLILMVLTIVPWISPDLPLLRPHLKERVVRREGTTVTFRQIHLGLQWGAGQATGEGLQPSPDSAAPRAPCRPPAALRAPPPRLPHLPQLTSRDGGGGTGGAFHCLGSGGVSGSSLPGGTTRDVPRPEISPLGIPEGWGGDVLNFYWLLMLCRRAEGKSLKASRTEATHFSQ